MDKQLYEDNCLDIQFDLLKGMYFDNKIYTEKYNLFSSKIMDDYFWNIGYLKEKIDKLILENIEDEFKSINRNPSLYIGRNDKYYIENKNILLENDYKLNDTDVYMVLENPKKIDITTNIKKMENEKEYNDFMKVLSSAYNDMIENSNENVYADAITECYYKAIKNTINSKEHIHIIAYDNDIPVSVATLCYVNGIGGIYNVGTSQGNWNKGYGKQIIAYIIKLFQKFGGEVLFLFTEYQSKNQKFYEKLGFNGKCIMEQYMKC